MLDKEAKAKEAKLKMWENYEEPKEEVKVEEEPQERKVNYTKVVVTEVTDNLTFYCQSVDSGL